MKFNLYFAIVLAFGFSALFVANKIALAEPYGSRDRYDNYDRDYDDRREQDELDSERRELDRERDRLEYDRSRLEEERRQQESAPPARAQEQCPRGFSPSENKCSVEERRRGCKDMRLPGGLGCVHR